LRVFNKPILILGGTFEAANLAATLHTRGHHVITSLAGKTREPFPVKGNVRVGGFGGVDGLVRYIIEHKIYMLVDITHPFANNISLNARKAIYITGVKYRQYQRPPWQQLKDDYWHSVPTIDAAVEAIPPKARVLLALGQQHISPFGARYDVNYLIRMVSQPHISLLIPHHHILFQKPGTVNQERTLLVDHGITHIVCRNSGGVHSYAKVVAARLIKIPIIMIDRQKKIPI
jgi:precorrin-6A/cobalt-precorrin-6A reductase